MKRVNGHYDLLATPLMQTTKTWSCDYLENRCDLLFATSALHLGVLHTH